MWFKTGKYPSELKNNSTIPSGLSCGCVIKNSPANAGDMGLKPKSGRSPGSTLVLLPGKSHEQRRLADYSLWGHNKLSMT